MLSTQLHTQRTTTTLTLTDSNQILVSNIPRGKYLLSINIEVGYLTVIDLLLSDNDNALIVAYIGSECANTQFDTNTADIFVEPTSGNYYHLILQYLNGTLSVLLTDDSATPPSTVTFDFLYLGSDVPSVNSNIGVDILSSSNGTGPINVSNDLQTIGRLRQVTNVYTNTTLDNTYDIVICNPTGSITVSLPQVSLNIGREYSIVNESINPITVNSNSGDTIDNGTSISTSLSTQYSKIKLTNDGSSIWFSNI